MSIPDRFRKNDVSQQEINPDYVEYIESLNHALLTANKMLTDLDKQKDKTISSGGIKLLLSLHSKIWTEACYDPYSASTRDFAKKLLTDIQGLNEELKFKT